MGILMPRDLYILKALRHGPLPFIKLHAQLVTISKHKYGDEFFNHVDVDTPASPSVVAAIKQENYLFTKSALRNRITVLLKDGVIKSKSYAYRNGKGRSALYVVGKLGIPQLHPHGFEESDIRCKLPHKFAIAHETLVADVVKSVKRETARIGVEVKIVDDNYLRKTKKKKRIPIPDLVVSMSFHLDSGKVLDRGICLEIDNDTISVADIYKKCTKLERSTIFLCTISSRIDKLRAYFSTMKDDKNYEKIVNKIFFTLISDFMAKGFIGAEIINVTGRSLQVIPPEFDIKPSRKPTS